MALWGSRVGPLRLAPAHFGYSFHDGMDVRLRGEIQIPAARRNKRHSYLFRLTPLIVMLGSSEYSVSYESAIGFGVYYPKFLKDLEGL